MANKVQVVTLPNMVRGEVVDENGTFTRAWMRFFNDLYVRIGKTSGTLPALSVSLPTFASNAAATGGGLVVGDVYILTATNALTVVV